MVAGGCPPLPQNSGTALGPGATAAAEQPPHHPEPAHAPRLPLAFRRRSRAGSRSWNRSRQQRPLLRRRWLRLIAAGSPEGGRQGPGRPARALPRRSRGGGGGRGGGAWAQGAQALGHAPDELLIRARGAWRGKGRAGVGGRPHGASIGRPGVQHLLRGQGRRGQRIREGQGYSTGAARWSSFMHTPSWAHGCNTAQHDQRLSSATQPHRLQ